MRKVATFLLLLCASTSFAAGGAFQIYNNKLSFPDGSEFSSAPKDGKTIYNGSGAPIIAATSGDFYLDTLNSRLYGPYNGSSWGVGVSLVGPKGDTGASPWVLSGSGSYYNIGNVGIGTATPNATLEVNGPFIRTISRAYNTDTLPPIITTTAWQDVTGRSKTYTKLASDTALRISYSENRFFRADPLSNSNGVIYELVIDGVPCPSGELTTIIPMNTNTVAPDSSTQIKSCFGLSAGSHTIKVRIKNFNGTGTLTAYFGHSAIVNSYWAIEVEEVR